MPLPPDPAASVEELYEALAPGLYRYALMLLTDASGAEDALQEAFGALIDGRPRPAHAPAYLRTAVRNACFSRLRRRRRWQGRELPLLEAREGAGDDPTERLAIERALRDLTPEQREVVHLHVYEAHTLREVAALTDVSINTVASRYRYALAHLRRRLASTRTTEEGP